MPAFRASLIVLLVCLLAPSLYAQETRTLDRSFDLASDGTVHLDTYAGRVDVRTWDRDRARVEVTIQGEDQTTVNNTKIRFDTGSDQLDVETDYDELENDGAFFGLFGGGSADRPSTDYTLTVPRTADLTVETYSAATTVEPLAGDLRFDGYSAALTVDRLVGDLRADTYSGDVQVGTIDGALTADTYSGSLEADSVAGPVEFSTYSGAATLAFADLSGDCRFDSYSGSVTATLPSDVGAVIETSEGALDTDLPVRIDRIEDDRIRATLGDGGPRLRFDTYSGTFSVRSR